MNITYFVRNALNLRRMSICRFFIFLFFYSISIGFAQSSELPKRHGVLMQSLYDAESQSISLRGWTVTGIRGDEVPMLKLFFREEELTGNDINWVERPDLTPENSATVGQYGAGFNWNVKLPKAVPAGIHPFRVSANYKDGSQVDLISLDTGATVFVVEKIRGRHWWILGIVLVAILVIGYIGRKNRNQRLPSSSPWIAGKTPYYLIGGLFTVLVALGVTGTSLGTLMKWQFAQSFLDVKGSTKSLMFSPREVRGDEWGVLMPNVLAQINHDPKFPVINTNVGLGGQNMGVIGMTGAPVKQWAALARPATWGYFVLPLRQAMSWQWQLPFWGGLLAIWCLFNVLRPGQRGLNLGLSFAFCVAPYAAAWSNWPLYATMFPAFAFVVATHLLRSDRLGKSALLGALLGWLIACWFLVLYPTWLIIVGSLLLFIGIAWCIENRAQLRFGRPQLLALCIAGIVVAAILGSWWLDTRDAVAIMKATEYPGRRGALPGGDMSWWWNLRGYNNAEVVLRLPGPVTNQSEASSYFLLPFALLALCVAHLFRTRERNWLVISCLAFIVCYWIFVFVGVPIWLAKYTMWGNMPTGRMEVGFGLVSFALFALVAYRDDDRPAMQKSAAVSWVLPGVIAAASGLLIAAVLIYTPLLFMPGGSIVYTTAMVIGGIATCWWLMKNKMGSAVAMFAVMHLITTLTFNPISRAPRDISLAEGNRPFVMDPEHPDRALRTIVINGDGIGPLTLAAAGVPISNGVLYYPHKVLWEKMGLPESEWAQVNRYQHLGFYLVPDLAEARGYSVAATSIDQVHVHVHPINFDFSKTGAKRLAVLADREQLLRTNPSLKWLGQFRNLHWYAVISDKD